MFRAENTSTVYILVSPSTAMKTFVRLLVRKFTPKKKVAVSILGLKIVSCTKNKPVTVVRICLNFYQPL